MGAETDAARAEVLASRAALLNEVQRLEGAARTAVDIPGKVRRAPAKTAGLAAGTAFVVLGGPQRLFRRARRAVLGPQADMPKSLLPKDVEKTVKKLGSDGDKVRGTLEREFARYLDDRAKVRKQADMSELATTVAANVLKPLSSRFGKQLVERLFAPDSAGFDEAVAKVRARYGPQADDTAEAAAERVPAERASPPPDPLFGDGARGADASQGPQRRS